MSAVYQGGIIAWVAFWAIYGQGVGAENMQSILTFGAAYALVILIEPLADLADSCRRQRRAQLEDRQLVYAPSVQRSLIRTQTDIDPKGCATRAALFRERRAMIDLHLIGIGTGNPDHLTGQARRAIAAGRSCSLVPHKAGKSDLADLRTHHHRHGTR